MKKGAHSAAHHHPHEQLVYVISGKLHLRVGEEWHILGPGGVVMIPGGVTHQAEVLEDTEVVDIFSPPREDFLGGGTPAYFQDVDKKKS
jgi:quercetin dioxygenase-like cupin family protein